MATGRKTIHSIMVSSTYTELLDHRRAIREVMSGQRLLPIAMEDDPPSPTRPLRYRRPASRQGRLVRILGMGLGTATANGRRMLNVLGSVAQFEREVMLERQREGIAKAKCERRYKGRAPTARAKAADVRRLAAEGRTREAIAAKLNIGVASVYRVLRAA